MHIALPGAFAVLAAFIPVAADETPQLQVEASPARVEVEPGTPGLRMIELPDLEFRLSIVPDCAGGDAESLSISVADSSETLGTTDLAGKSRIETELLLPAKQTGPLPVNRFCPTDTPVGSLAAALEVRDAFTAHLSLRCVRDGQQSIVYVTVPLSLDLYCTIPDDAAHSSGQDVADSAVSPPRY